MKKIKLSIFIKEISEKYEQQGYVVNFWINVINEAISNCLKNGNALTFLDFGTFKLRKIKETKRTNLRTGEAFLDKEHFVPSFHFSAKTKTEIKKIPTQTLKN